MMSTSKYDQVAAVYKDHIFLASPALQEQCIPIQGIIQVTILDYIIFVLLF